MKRDPASTVKQESASTAKDPSTDSLQVLFYSLSGGPPCFTSMEDWKI